jgi:hypothetical protein
MPKGRNTRLDRMNAKADHTDSSQASGRDVAGALAAVSALVRRRLIEKGIDPERVGALRLFPAAEVRQISDAGEEFVLADRDSLAAQFVEKIGAMAGPYHDGHEPDFAHASLAELLAWCFATGKPAEGEL